MELSNKTFANYHTKGTEKGETIRTLSVGQVMDFAKNWKDNCKANRLDPYNVPFFVKIDEEFHVCEFASFGFRGTGPFASLDVSADYDKLRYVAPDTEDPASTEVEWKSRGVSDGLDVSGFVRSRNSGLRLLHMVQDILGTETPKSRLDYREREPDWIQFKFQSCEFDVRKIHELAKDNGDKINKKILSQCVNKNLS